MKSNYCGWYLPCLFTRETIIVRTNHHSLKFLLEQKVGTPSQQKWVSKLLGYDFVIEYKKGKENRIANALFRKCTDTKDSSISVISFPDPTWIEDLKATYSQDVNIQDILLKLQEGKLEGKGYSLRNGLLFKNGRIFLG